MCKHAQLTQYTPRAGENCLALPKLNLQFLTFHDYLLRNFNLFRLEATYEIREDISDVIGRVGAARSALHYCCHAACYTTSPPLSLQQLTHNTVVAATLAATVPGIAAAAAIAGHSKKTDRLSHRVLQVDLLRSITSIEMH